MLTKMTDSDRVDADFCSLYKVCFDLKKKRKHNQLVTFLYFDIRCLHN